MADNFFDNNGTGTTDPAPVEKIKLGEREFDQAELDRLVSLGEKAAEIEKNHGSLDKFVSESGRRADEIGRYKKELDELKAKQPPTETKVGELTPEQIELAKKQLQDLIGGPPVTQSEFAKMYVAMREGERLIDECEGLAKEIDGKDGRPKFDRQEIIDYMSETGIKKPLAAYKDKYEKEIKDWETKQLTTKPKTDATLPPNGQQDPKVVRPTRDNLQQLIKESLYGPNE